MRGRRLHRLLQIIYLLRGPTSWNARRLAEHFQTSRRNIYRDLAVLELAGVPYHFDPDFGDGGGYRIRESFFFPHVGLTEQECLDLAVVTRLVESQSIPLLNEACHVRDKLLGTLPAKQQTLITEAAELFDMLSVGLADHSRCRHIMVELQQALLSRKQIGGTYRSPHQKRAVRLQLQPRRAFFAGQAWYLAAHDNKSGETKLFRLARFQEIKMLDKAMTISPQFSLRDFLGNAWTVHRGDRDFHVEILFDAEAAPIVEECRWHHTQELETQNDGSLIFRATVSGLDEIKFWVLNWGPRATVLKPKELADEVRRLAQEILDRYQQPLKVGPKEVRFRSRPTKTTSGDLDSASKGPRHARR